MRADRISILLIFFILNAAVAFAAISTGIGQNQDLSKLGAEKIIENLDDIENLEMLDETALEDAMQTRYGIASFNVESGARIQEDRLISNTGEYVYLSDLEGYDIIVDQNGDIIISGSEEVPERGTFYVGNPAGGDEGTSEYIVYQGKRIAYSGKLYLDNGKAFVPKDTAVRIEGYKISAGLKEIELHLSKQESRNHDYVAIYEGGVQVNSYSGKVALRALPGNDLFNMLRKDYYNGGYAAAEEESIVIQVGGGDYVEIYDRDSKGFIPLMKHEGAANGNTHIKTGKLEFSLKGGRWYKDKVERYETDNSVALEIVSDKKKMVITSSNRYALYDENRKITSTSDQKLKISNELGFNMIKTMDDLKHEYGNVNFYISDGSDAPYYNTVQTVYSWLEDKPGAEKYFDGFILGWSDISVLPSDGKKYLTVSDSQIENIRKIGHEVSTRDILPPNALDHEFTHILDTETIEKENTVRTPKDERLGSKYEDFIIDNFGNNLNSYKYMSSSGIEQQKYIDGLLYDTYGIYIYSLYDKNENDKYEYPELASVFSEQEPSKIDIGKHPELETLAQLELDKIYNLDPPAPSWMKDAANKRFRDITGKNPEPCKIYNANCNTHRAGNITRVY